MTSAQLLKRNLGNGGAVDSDSEKLAAARVQAASRQVFYLGARLMTGCRKCVFLIFPNRPW